jgi:tRNA (guanine26-N2/guanine27-N2)-dimethyltransferase
VRILIGAALQQAGALGYTIEPVFSLYQGQTYRVLLRVLGQARNPEPNYGFLGYCAHCGQFAMPSWRYLSRSTCALGHGPLCLTGPLWLGPLHDVGTLALMRALAIEWGWGDRVAYLDLLRGEAELPPYHFSLGEIGRRGKLDVPQRDHLIQALRDRGYEACATQFAQDAIKTTASLAVCIEVARVLLQLKTQP